MSDNFIYRRNMTPEQLSNLVSLEARKSEFWSDICKQKIRVITNAVDVDLGKGRFAAACTDYISKADAVKIGLIKGDA